MWGRGFAPSKRGEAAQTDVQWQNAERRGDWPVTSFESHPQSQSNSKVARRWTVIASGLLLLALALVVIYTGPNAFLSPVALVVVAAIGLAALLLQVWFRRDLPNIHPPLWLNVLGILCAMVALFADNLRMTRRTLDLVAFAAVVCFGISGALILRALRRQVRLPQPPATE
jgi:Na+(H+)/acetate symporter ActP